VVSYENEPRRALEPDGSAMQGLEACFQPAGAAPIVGVGAALEVEEVDTEEEVEEEAVSEDEDEELESLEDDEDEDELLDEEGATVSGTVVGEEELLEGAVVAWTGDVDDVVTEDDAEEEDEEGEEDEEDELLEGEV
jgi:hypothetical protein